MAVGRDDTPVLETFINAYLGALKSILCVENPEAAINDAIVSRSIVQRSDATRVRDLREIAAGFDALGNKLPANAVFQYVEEKRAQDEKKAFLKKDLNDWDAIIFQAAYFEAGRQTFVNNIVDASRLGRDFDPMMTAIRAVVAKELLAKIGTDKAHGLGLGINGETQNKLNTLVAADLVDEVKQLIHLQELLKQAKPLAAKNASNRAAVASLEEAIETYASASNRNSDLLVHQLQNIIVRRQLENKKAATTRLGRVLDNALESARERQKMLDQAPRPPLEISLKKVKDDLEKNLDLNVKNIVGREGPTQIVFQAKTSQAAQAYDHAKNFQDRGSSFHDGIRLLIENLPKHEIDLEVTKTDLLRLADHFHRSFQQEASDLSDFSAGKALLINYLAQVGALLKTYTHLENPYKDIFSAEVFSVWAKERAALMTASSHDYSLAFNGQGDPSARKQTIVQVDIPQFRLTEAQEKEYQRVLDPDKNKHPDWFKQLRDWEQHYLQTLLAEGRDHGESISQTLKAIPTTLRRIPGLANYSEHALLIYDEENRLIASSHRSRSGIVTPLELTNLGNINDPMVARITEQNIAQVITSSLSEQVRAHVAKWGLGEEGVITVPVLFQTLVSPGFLEKFDSVNKDNVTHSYKQMAVEKLIKALNNPEENKAWLATVGLRVNEQGYLKLRDNEANEYQVDLRVISTNHGINKLRILPDVLNHERTINADSATALLKTAAIFLNSILRFHEHHRSDHYGSLGTQLGSIRDFKDLTGKDLARIRPLIQHALGVTIENDSAINPLTHQQQQTTLMLLHAVDHYLDVTKHKTEDRHRQLFINSYEQIITEACGGTAYGSCKSGKDRKATEVLHTDAMMVYFSRYGALPLYNDPPQQRALFCNIFADLYHTRHQQENAQQNALGSRGLKSIHQTLPPDLVHAIETRGIASDRVTSNAYAKLNKVNKDKLKKAEPSEAFIVNSMMALKNEVEPQKRGRVIGESPRLSLSEVSSSAPPWSARLASEDSPRSTILQPLDRSSTPLTNTSAIVSALNSVPSQATMGKVDPVFNSTTLGPARTNFASTQLTNNIERILQNVGQLRRMEENLQTNEEKRRPGPLSWGTVV